MDIARPKTSNFLDTQSIINYEIQYGFLYRSWTYARWVLPADRYALYMVYTSNQKHTCPPSEIRIPSIGGFISTNYTHQTKVIQWLFLFQLLGINTIYMI